MKKALIVCSLSGFLGFLKKDIDILQSMGYDVHLAANAGANAQAMQGRRGDRTTFHQIDFSSNSPFSKASWIALKEVKKLLKEERFDLIHCHTPIVGALVRVAAMPYRRRGAKVIYSSHGFYFHKGSDKKTWLIYHTIEKAMSALCDAIITINTEDFAAARKMHCRKVYHINGVGCDTAKYQNVQIDADAYRESLGIRPDQIMVLDVGELSARKNHKTVIEAVSKLKDPNIVLVICGKGISGSGTYKSLKTAAQEGGANVIFAGHRRDIPQLCACADIGVLASTREGLGMTGIEMLSAGLPLVTSNVHGIKDYMTDGKTGYMCDPYDVDAFAEGIRKLSDPETRNALRENCLKSAAQFDISVSYQQRKEIYLELLSE